MWISLRCDAHGGHFVSLAQHRPVWPYSQLDLVHHIHARCHLAYDRILAVEEITLLEHDEKLAVGRIRALATGHADDTTGKGGFAKLSLNIRQIGSAP